MINLIGPDSKKHLRAARRNSIWMRYTFLLLSTLVATSLILGGAAFYYYQQKLGQDATAKANDQKSHTDSYTKAKTAVTNFRKGINTAKAVFDAETYYSVIITEVAKTMPKNTILDSIKFDSSTFQGQQSLAFRAKTIDDALALKTAFGENPPLSAKVRFSKVEKTDLSGTPAEGLKGQYPVTITMFMDLKKPDSSLGATASKVNGR